ncbi:TIGR02677 family protein [Paenibacillus sp. NPDC058174]|uniref:TIGR02677 family protein n=1 Tax=Paenibacillus sp. NPDC058174 TaxID=3346366 RepID=UPI0036DB6EFB
MTDKAALNNMKEAEYLVLELPYCRIIMRFFYREHKAHIHYIHSDRVLNAVRLVYPDYDELSCRRNLDQLVKWGLIRLVPTQSKPANLRELKNLPRIYQAERVALKLEQLRVEVEEEGDKAAGLNPTALEHFIQSLAELVEWTAKHVGKGYRVDWEDTYRLWHSTLRTFTDFARSMEDYLSDLPRHRPKDVIDLSGYRDYRDIITKYLSQNIEKIYQRREYIRYKLQVLQPYTEYISEEVAAISSEQVRSDGTRLDEGREKLQCLRDIQGITAYFAENGDITVMLKQAEEWIEDITGHARRLSEQHLFSSTVREQTFLELADTFINLSPDKAHWLGQVAFGATLPFHWKGEASPDLGISPWEKRPIDITLQVVKRGPRQKTPLSTTRDRSFEQIERMAREYMRREESARALSELFGSNGVIDINEISCNSSDDRQQILKLVYRALSEEGRTRIGYADWYITLEAPKVEKLGNIHAPDGRLTMPAFTLKLHRERD